MEGTLSQCKAQAAGMAAATTAHGLTAQTAGSPECMPMDWKSHTKAGRSVEGVFCGHSGGGLGDWDWLGGGVVKGALWVDIWGSGHGDFLCTWPGLNMAQLDLPPGKALVQIWLVPLKTRFFSYLPIASWSLADPWHAAEAMPALLYALGCPRARLGCWCVLKSELNIGMQNQRDDSCIARTINEWIK